MSSLFDKTQPLTIPPPSRKGIYLFPIAVCIGILVMLGSTVENLWAKAPVVDFSRVRMGENQEQSATVNDPLFRAAGWLRSGPYPIRVTALASGVVEKVHVIEGDLVRKGQLLVELDDEDAKLDLDTAVQTVSVAKTKVKVQQSKTDTISQKLSKLLVTLERSKVALEGLKKDHLRLSSSGPGISLREIEKAFYKVEEKKVELKEIEAELKTLKSEKNTVDQELSLFRESLKLSEIEEKKARLRLKRMKVYSPSDGRVKTLLARVGRKQMLESDNPLSTTIAFIYQPNELFVAVDVPLMDVFKVQLQQKAKIEVEGFERSLEGLVTHISGEADEQKNTLAVRVQVLNPDPLLRPGMLSQVIFLGTGQSHDRKNYRHKSLLHPEALVGDKVAIIDEDNTLKWKLVKVTGQKEKGWLVIEQGLGLGEKTVLNPNPDWKNGQPLILGAES